MDWKSVIHRIKTGDYSELEKVYTEYRHEFYRWVMKQYNCSYEDVQDIYQQSIIVLYENIIHDRIVSQNSSIKTYLFAIGKNKYYELIRDKHRQNVELTAQMKVEDTVEEPEENMLALNSLGKSLDKLGNPCKSILELYYYHKKSMQDIAERLGLKNTDTAKNMKYKCLKRLKSLYNVSEI
jgi:RNA polymerase sigma-70 factor (ECF subfamily)